MARLARTFATCIECPDDLTVVAIGCAPMHTRMAAGAVESDGVGSLHEASLH